MCGFAPQSVLAVLFRNDHLPAEFRQVFLHRSIEQILPPSTSVITAVAVIGLDCEAIQKTESAAIFFPPAMSANPTVSTASTLSLSATSATAPASSCFSTNVWSRPLAESGASAKSCAGNASTDTSKKKARVIFIAALVHEAAGIVHAAADYFRMIVFFVGAAVPKLSSSVGAIAAGFVAAVGAGAAPSACRNALSTSCAQ